jgi:hypothetical protein
MLTYESALKDVKGKITFFMVVWIMAREKKNKPIVT